MKTLSAPFPYFGGKSRWAKEIWDILGNPKWYIEPFAGSAAVLLARPRLAHHGVEVIGDKDGHISNVWRSIKLKPNEVARELEILGGAKEVNLKAIKLASPMMDALVSDLQGCYPVIAARWLYKVSSTIATWEHGGTALDFGQGGRGIHSQGYRKDLTGMLKALAERLKFVRILNGDWKRTCTDSHIRMGGIHNAGGASLFLDPPYHHASSTLYSESDSEHDEVLAFCKRWENEPKVKIILAGLEGEYDLDGWEARTRAFTTYRKRGLDCLYIFPPCRQAQKELF